MANKLIRGRHVITDPGRLPSAGLIEDGAVAVRSDSIAAVGTYANLRERYPDAEEIGSDRHIVIPGLINTHHHGWGLTSLQLGFTDDYLESWILDVWRLKPVDTYLDTLWSDLKNIRSGVTTLLHAGIGRDWRRYEEETRAKLRAHEASGIRVSYGVHTTSQNLFVYEENERFLHRLPGDLSSRIRSTLTQMNLSTTNDFFDLLERLHWEYSQHPRITIMCAPVAPQWVSDEILGRIRQKATAFGMAIHLHCLESPYQREFGRLTYGKSTVEHLNQMGFLGPDVSLGHAVWLTDRDIAICADTGTSVAHNASSNLRLRVGILPLDHLLSKGVNVSIGMDGMTLNDDEDMLQELRLVSKLHRLPRGLHHASCASSFDVFKMATINGARTLTMEADLGVLEEGRKADIVLIDSDVAFQPYLDARVHVIDAILYRAKGRDVDTVLVDGEVILRDGKFVEIDEDKILRDLVAEAEAPLEPLTKRWFDLLNELRPHVVDFYERWESPDYRPYYSVNSMV